MKNARVINPRFFTTFRMITAVCHPEKSSISKAIEGSRVLKKRSCYKRGKFNG